MSKSSKIKTFSLLLVAFLAIVILSACGGVDFNVDFVADGQVIHTVSTNGNEVIKLPNNPTKDGYEFKGWYWDENSWQRPFTANSLLNEPLTGDMRVYAKFEVIGSHAIETLPIPGTAYLLFLDQDNVGGRYYLNGSTDAYCLGMTSDVTKAVNVYVENANIADKYNVFCVMNGERKYITLGHDGTKYALSFNNAPITAFEYDLAEKTFYASLDGHKFALGTGAETSYKRVGPVNAFENNFVVHLIQSSNPDEVIPELTAKESTIADIVVGEIGLYKTTGKVYGINAQSFVIGDDTGKMLVYVGTGWTPDVKLGDVVTVEGKTAVYGASIQFGIDATYTVGANETLTVETPKSLTTSELDAYSSASKITIEYIKVTGVFAVSGYYYNVNVPGATVVVSVAYPIDDVTYFNGKTVEVVGYASSISSGKFLNVMVTSLTEVTGETDVPSQPENPDTPEIPEVTYTEDNIANIVASELGNFKTSATVVGINAQSFLISDDTGNMLVYVGSGWTPDVKIGDKITIQGGTSIYGGATQFKTNLSYTVTDSSTVNYPTPHEPSIPEIDAYLSASKVTVEYVKINGKFAVSGTFYNVNVDGAIVVVSITYPKDDLSNFDGKEVELLGYVTGVTGNSNKFLNIMLTSINEVTGSTDIPVVPEEPEIPEIPEEPEIPEIPEEPEIPEVTYTESDIVGIITGELGNYKTNATVIAINAQSFLISDGTANMLVYIGYNWTPDVKVGDTVTVQGATTVYGGAKQFKTELEYTVTGSTTITNPIIKELTSTDIDAYASLSSVTVEYIRLTGNFSISGNYYNVNVDGATVVASVTYPIDDLSSLNDKKVEVVGYVTGVTGSSSKFLNIMVTSISEIEGSTDVPEIPEIPENPQEPNVESLTIAEAIELGASMSQDTFTTKKYYVTGVVKSVYNTTYGNMYITDSNGNELKVYGTWSSDGTTRFDGLDNKPEVGDTITLYGVVGNYNGPQMENGWIITIVPAE